MGGPDIFLSYNREDAARARHFAEGFAAEGLEVWWDVALRSGEAYDKVTEAALRAAKAVVVLWSARSVDSRWVRAEATLADRNKTLMPAMIEPCERPIMFELVQTADLMHWQGDRADPVWQAFVRDVSAFCQHKPSASVIPAKSGAALPGLDRVSVVVLPFANMSADPEQDYFADGITEDVITDLSKVSAIGVISRNSAFTFKGRHVDIPDVARQLNVTHVVEGSVRRAGSRLRIAAQLIDGSTNSHIWAERWDRDLDDIFALQDELSQAIVAALKIKLMPQEKQAIVRRGTASVQAYDLLLKAQAQARLRRLEGAKRAVELSQEAVNVDPEFVDGWIQLAFAWLGLAIFASDGHEAIDQYQQALRQAIAIAPDSHEAASAQAALCMDTRDWMSADTALTRFGVRTDPRFSQQGAGVSFFFATVGRMNEAIEGYQAEVRADPLMNMEMVQFAYICAGREADAKAELARTSRLQGDPAVCEFMELTRRMASEDLASVREQLTHFYAIDSTYLPFLDQVLADLDRPEEARAVIRAAAADPRNAGFSHLQGISYFAAYFGDDALALDCFRRAFIDQRGLTMVVVWHPLFARLRQTEGFKQLVRDLGFADYWHKSGHWADFARPLGDDDFELIA